MALLHRECSLGALSVVEGAFNTVKAAAIKNALVDLIELLNG